MATNNLCFILCITICSKRIFAFRIGIRITFLLTVLAIRCWLYYYKNGTDRCGRFDLDIRIILSFNSHLMLFHLKYTYFVRKKKKSAPLCSLPLPYTQIIVCTLGESCWDFLANVAIIPKLLNRPICIALYQKKLIFFLFFSPPLMNTLWRSHYDDLDWCRPGTLHRVSNLLHRLSIAIVP